MGNIFEMWSESDLKDRDRVNEEFRKEMILMDLLMRTEKPPLWSFNKNMDSGIVVCLPCRLLPTDCDFCDKCHEMFFATLEFYKQNSIRKQ